VTKKQRHALQRCSVECVGKRVHFRYKGRPGGFHVGTVKDVVSVIVSDYNHMIQRIQLAPELERSWGFRYAYRTCYYTLAAKTRNPVWGQYHALVPAEDYRRLARKAYKKGWLGLPKA